MPAHTPLAFRVQGDLQELLSALSPLSPWRLWHPLGLILQIFQNRTLFLEQEHGPVAPRGDLMLQDVEAQASTVDGEEGVCV